METHKLIDILNYIKILGSFPNTYVTYRIILAISVVPTMSKKILNKLALLFIKEEILN